MFDWEKAKSHTAKCHEPFKCSCGGTFKTFAQSLCKINGNFVDVMEYRCDKCKRVTNQSFDVDYLNKK